jgi:hypothetical protein
MEDLSKTARKALATTDWRKVDATADEDIARQIAANPDAASDMGLAGETRRLAPASLGL